MTKRKPSYEANILLEKHLAELRLYYEPEYKFHHSRKWRVDYFLSNQGIAIEIEGGVFSRGRHTRGVGFLNDMEKYNTATMMGYRVLRFSTQQVLDGSAKAFLKSWLS